MDKLLTKPLKPADSKAPGRYEKYNLRENPFPSTPSVNKESSDNRYNGTIYELEIHKGEYEHIVQHFLTHPQADVNHLRLGYIIDESYIGRGNGKSAFLLNLQQTINRQYCLDISKGVNKCFGIYVSPDSSGRTKTFLSFVDAIFAALLDAKLIATSLAILRAEALKELNPKFKIENSIKTEDEFREYLNDPSWYAQNNIDVNAISELILRRPELQDLPPSFPLCAEAKSLFKTLTQEDDFKNYYKTVLKAPKERIDFVFSQLIDLFLAAGFNGAYLLVDDFERIPDFQSARLKRDFAIELRRCLFDGIYRNAKIGFYNTFFVMHAGVPRLVQEAWAESGLEPRSPILPTVLSNHIIRFKKLPKEHAHLLLLRYLGEYRINPKKHVGLFPFTQEAVSRIGEEAELNAARILQIAYSLLETACDNQGAPKIDVPFLEENLDKSIIEDSKSKKPTSESVNLLTKAMDVS